MSNIAIVTDSLATMPPELAEELGIRIVPVGITINGQAYHDDIDIHPDEFWKMFDSIQTFSTSAPTPGEFAEAFRDASKKTEQIICLIVSKMMSATFQTASKAREMVLAENPRLKIEVIDSQTSMGAMGFMAIEAARAAQRDAGQEKVLEIIQNMKSRVKSICGIDTLKYLIRSGRSPIKVFTKELRGVRPLVGLVSGSGAVDSLGTVKGKSLCFQKLVDMIGQYSDPNKPLHVMVHYTKNKDDGKKLMRMVESRYHPAEIYLTPYSAVSCGHSGSLNSISFYS